MSHVKKIVIVGTNNTTRSFMAEAVFHRLCEEKNLEEVEISSRGLVVLFPEPVNPKAAQAVGSNGYKLREFQATKLTEADVEEADLLLTVLPEEKERILTDYREKLDGKDMVYSLCEFVGEQNEIPNPYGKELEDYIQCFEIVREICERCFAKIF